MFFSQEDYKKIQLWLQKNAIKDTEFNDGALPLNGEETIALVQNKQNIKVFLKDFIAQLALLGSPDFINISDKFGENYISLSQAIKLIPYRSRKIGQVITFLDEFSEWRVYQFQGERVNQWNNTTLWIDLLQAISDSSNIVPDEEDITGVLQGGRNLLKFRDKNYNKDDYSGLGRVFLRKNLTTVTDPSTMCKISTNLLTQEMISREYTIYIIQYDYTLNGNTIVIPKGSILDFQGGSIDDGTLSFEDDTKIKEHFIGNAIIEGNPLYIDYVADEEDITSLGGVAKFKDKEYNTSEFSGLGRVYLRKNISNGKNILTQDMINKPNTRYIIQYDHDLDGKEITIPEGCILDFQGGKLKNGSINFNKCIIDSKKACFNNIVINGIIGNKTIFVDWFSPYKEYPSSKDYFTDIENDNVDIINNILNSVKSNSTNEQKIIEFGYGIYKFKESIKINYNLTSVVFKGQGIRNTAIVTPNGRNIEFISGAYLCNCVFKDVWFEANGANFYFIIELDKSLPSAMDNIFENVSFYSHDADDCCFGLSLARGTSVYHNTFRNILVHKKTGYIFKGLTGLGTVFDNLTDININFTANGTRSDKETTIFGFCKEVTIINSNFTNTNYKSIYFYDNTYQDALGLYLLAINCNFESFHGPFVETGINTSITLEFIRTSFVSENWDNHKKDFIIYRPIKLIGIPKSISNYVVTNGSTTINKHDTIVESSSAYDLKYSCVDINLINSKFLSSDFLEVNENNPNINIEYLDKQYIIKKTNQYSADEFNLIFKDFRVPVIYDFNNPPQEFTSIDNCILKLKNPTKDNCTLNLNNIPHVVNDSIVYNNNIVAVNNNNNIVVQVKHNNNTIDYIFPFETVLIIGGWFILKPYCEVSVPTGKVILGIKSGNVYNISIQNLGTIKCKCVRTGCGLFAYSKRRSNTYVYSSNDIMYYGYISHNGYIYKCIKDGTTSDTEPIYSTELNSVTVDGTAEYLCIGESPIIAPISIYDIDNVTSELFDMSYFGGEYTFEGASNKPVFYSSNGTKYDADGFKHEFTRIGITGNRPTLDGSSQGFQYFDVTLNKPIWWTGFRWVDSTGANV